MREVEIIGRLVNRLDSVQSQLDAARLVHSQAEAGFCRTLDTYRETLASLVGWIERQAYDEGGIPPEISEAYLKARNLLEKS